MPTTKSSGQLLIVSTFRTRIKKTGSFHFGKVPSFKALFRNFCYLILLCGISCKMKILVNFAEKRLYWFYGGVTKSIVGLRLGCLNHHPFRGATAESEALSNLPLTLCQSLH